jgi:DnaK suppressor protein
MSSAEARVAPHLSDQSLASLRSMLLRQRAEHDAEAAEVRAVVDELTGRADTPSLLEREMAEASATYLDTVARETRDALCRLEDGTYGICATCGDPIPYERLEAIPHARQCVRCP